MKSLIKRLKPINRHLLIIPHKKKKTQNKSTVLLPDDYSAKEERYILATVVDIASDCNTKFRQLHLDASKDCNVIVEKSMIQEIETRDKTYYLILENYVMGILANA
jgi:co-chaperonin GroES (HSP10)